MDLVDTWFWIALVSLVVLVIPVLAIRRAAKNRVDPTNVSIDADLAHRVRVLCRQDKKVEAVKELRDATGLALRDALTIVEKLAASDPRKRG
jgi:ribosomal protein L7/L12